MHNDANESKRAVRGARADALSASAVDAVLADETAIPVVAQRGTRRELSLPRAEAERHTIDVPHVVDAPPDGELLRRLSCQLGSLQRQQEQIRRLLEQAEARREAAASGWRLDA